MSRWIAGIARAQWAIVRRLLQAKVRSQLRLAYCRTVIAEIDNLSVRVVAEEIAMDSRLPSPSIRDVMGVGSRRNFGAFRPIARTAPLFRLVTIATGVRTAIAHSPFCEN